MKEANTICKQLGGTYHERNVNLVPDVKLGIDAHLKAMTKCGGCR